MCNRDRWLFQGTIVFVWGIMLLQPIGAQQPAVTGMQSVVIQRPPPPAPPTQAQYENYIQVVKSEKERAEARARDVKAQLISLDADIESRVNRIVSLLGSVRDSTEGTSSRIRRAKADLIKGLKNSAVYYAQQRDQRKKEMNNPYAQLTDQELARDVAALNERIEVRITQSLEIVSSLAQHEEVAPERYRNNDSDYSNESREYRKGQRDVSASVKIKADVATDLRASIDRFTREKKAREEELRLTRDPQKQMQLTNDIEVARQTIEDRRDQLEKLVSAPKPATRAVSGKAAFEMDQMLDEMAADLKSDFAKFKSLVYEIDTARARVNLLNARLEKATAALDAMSSSEKMKPEAVTGK
jgi:hypothetical protein